jgi:glutamine amidotransferase
MRIAIIDDGLGNTGSVKSALEFYRYDVRLIHEYADIDGADLLILAGVGSFRTAVEQLRKRMLWKHLDNAVCLEHKPVLGICLGMQLMASWGEEDGHTQGWGWIPGKVVRIPDTMVKVPHIGWNRVSPVTKNDVYFRGIRSGFFYFMHGYHFIPENPDHVIATTGYGDMTLVAGVRNKNVVGLQFHPEKSQGDGLRILRNVVEGLVCR